MVEQAPSEHLSAGEVVGLCGLAVMAALLSCAERCFRELAAWLSYVESVAIQIISPVSDSVNHIDK